MVLKKTRIMQFTVVVGNIIQRKQGGGNYQDLIVKEHLVKKIHTYTKRTVYKFPISIYNLWSLNIYLSLDEFHSWKEKDQYQYKMHRYLCIN